VASMDSSPSFIPVLAYFVGSFGIGAILITVVVVDRIQKQAFLTALYSLFAAALFVFGNIKDPHPANTSTPPEPGVNLAFVANNTYVTLLIAGFATLVVARFLLPANSKIRKYFRERMIPALWATASGSTEIAEDVERRWYVTVAAATGNIVGIRLTDQASLHAFYASFTFERIFIVGVISVIAFILIGPGEELLLGATANASLEQASSHSPFMEMIHNTTGRSWAKWIGFIVCVAFINVGEKCMDDALSSGHAQSALQMLIAAAPAGVITYYWCAAIQRNTKTVADAAFGPSMIVAAFLTIGGILIVAFVTAHATYLYGLPKYGSWLTLAVDIPMVMIFVVLGIAFILLLNLFQYGFASAAGGVIIDTDRSKPERSSYFTIIRAMALIIVLQVLTISALFGLLNFVLRIFSTTLSDESFVDALWSVAGTVFWGIGLVIARFPKVLERGRNPLPVGTATETG
jgi:hypothetical protein